MMFNKVRSPLLIVVLINGCASPPEKPAATVPVEERSVPVEVHIVKLEGVTRTEPRKQAQVIVEADKSYDQRHDNETPAQAVVALITEAERYAVAGRGEQAAASLERALRIDPKNALLWHRLAVIRLQQGHWDQAITLARKSNFLSGIDYELQSGNWEVIALAYEALGQSGKAREARKKSKNLKGKG